MKTNLNVDLLLSALSEIMSERAGAKVTVKKGETNHDICGVKKVGDIAVRK